MILSAIAAKLKQRAKGDFKGRHYEAALIVHGQRVFHLSDGRWWDGEAASWRDGAGRFICLSIGSDDVLGQVRTTRVVLATGHRDHDTANNRSKNLTAFCQRCHMNHDRPKHRRRRWRTLFRRKALGDLFKGPYSNA